MSRPGCLAINFLFGVCGIVAIVVAALSMSNSNSATTQISNLNQIVQVLEQQTMQIEALVSMLPTMAHNVSYTLIDSGTCVIVVSTPPPVSQTIAYESYLVDYGSTHGIVMILPPIGLPGRRFTVTFTCTSADVGFDYTLLGVTTVTRPFTTEQIANITVSGPYNPLCSNSLVVPNYCITVISSTSLTLTWIWDGSFQNGVDSWNIANSLSIPLTYATVDTSAKRKRK